MGIRFYDEALVQKIQNWIKDPNMKILKPDEVSRLYQIVDDINNDAPLTLPLISISRAPSVEILSINKQALTFMGKKIVSSDDSNAQLTAIPIRLNYQIDIYTRYFEEGDEYVRNFLFNLINYPKLNIFIPYNDLNIEHTSNIQVFSTVEDTSDISQRLFPDQFTRWTIRLAINDAYLFSVPILTRPTISEVCVVMGNDTNIIKNKGE